VRCEQRREAKAEKGRTDVRLVGALLGAGGVLAGHRALEGGGAGGVVDAGVEFVRALGHDAIIGPGHHCPCQPTYINTNLDRSTTVVRSGTAESGQHKQDEGYEAHVADDSVELSREVSLLQVKM
jgi:hypothetical protein